MRGEARRGAARGCTKSPRASDSDGTGAEVNDDNPVAAKEGLRPPNTSVVAVRVPVPAVVLGDDVVRSFAEQPRVRELSGGRRSRARGYSV